MAAPGTRFVLYAPGLSGPYLAGFAGSEVARQAVYEDLPLPALATLLERGRQRPSALREAGFEGRLCELFELERPDNEDWPVAALTYALDFGARPAQGCLRADPVHLAPDLRDVILHPVSEFGLSSEQAHHLVQGLNAHFAASGWRLEVGHPERWYLLRDEPWRVRTCAPRTSTTGRLEDMMPTGADASALHQIMNEAQMVLHASASNSAGGSHSGSYANSLWLWGAGSAPSSWESPWSRVCHDEPLAAALAAAAGVHANAMADESGAQSLLTSIASGESVLAVVSSGQAVAARGDVASWRDWITWLEQAWCVPLLAALRTGQVRNLELTWGARQDVHVARGDLWRWWRRAARPDTMYEASK